MDRLFNTFIYLFIGIVIYMQFFMKLNKFMFSFIIITNKRIKKVAVNHELYSILRAKLF